MTKKAPDIASFSREIVKLMKKHNCYIVGNVRLKLDDDFTDYTCEPVQDIKYGLITDRGNFLSCSYQEKREESSFNPISSKITLMDKDKLLANGILSPIDQKSAFHNRRDWADHLKQHNCVEFGNDLNNAKIRSDIRGDYNVREELGKATYEVASKYGY